MEIQNNMLENNMTSILHLIYALQKLQYPPAHISEPKTTDIYSIFFEKDPPQYPNEYQIFPFKTSVLLPPVNIKVLSVDIQYLQIITVSTHSKNMLEHLS